MTAIPQTAQGVASPGEVVKIHSQLPLLLIAIAFFADLLFPGLIFRYIPGSLRWIPDIAIAMLATWFVIRMVVFNRISFPFLLLLLISLLGVFSSYANGESPLTIVWGWWLMFRFPLVALFANQQSNWPVKLKRYLTFFLVGVTVFEVAMQSIQYLRGVPPGDQVGGTLGKNGTGVLIIFEFLVLCFCFGNWITTRKPYLLLAAIALSFISSILGEMKLFIPVILFLTLFGCMIYIFIGKELWRLVPYGFVIITVIGLFFVAYNTFIPDAKEYPLQRYIENPANLIDYLNINHRYQVGIYTWYDIGRNYALSYGWNQLKRDPVILMFGLGLGARAESRALNIAGAGITSGNIGLTIGTSLMVIMQETGLVGLSILAVFCILVVYRLFIRIKRSSDIELNGLRYGIILFTLLWPVWIWYNTAWVLRLPMILYWSLLGYTLRPDENEAQTRRSGGEMV